MYIFKSSYIDWNDVEMKNKHNRQTQTLCDLHFCALYFDLSENVRNKIICFIDRGSTISWKMTWFVMEFLDFNPVVPVPAACL